MKDIVILGGGGFAQEVAFLIEEINNDRKMYNILGFIEKEQSCDNVESRGYPVLDESWLLKQNNICVALGIGNPVINLQLIEKLENKKFIYPNLVHPGAVCLSKKVKMGQGNIVCAGNIFTVNITIGSFNIFNLSSTYGHDVNISDFSVFNPGVKISGNVSVGKRCLIGVGAVVMQNVTITDDVVIGAASFVHRSIEEKGTYFGVPAKKIK